MTYNFFVVYDLYDLTEKQKQEDITECQTARYGKTGMDNIRHKRPKSHKETQSPMLKVFTDLVHKDKCDPEKSCLLGTILEPKNKKYHTSSSPRSRQPGSLCESPTYILPARKPSGSDRKVSRQHNDSSPQHTYVQPKATRKKEYAAYSSKNKVNKKKEAECSDECSRKSSSASLKSNKKATHNCPEDSISAMSCALKRIMTSQYSFVGYFLVIIIIAVLLGMLTFCHALPALTSAMSTTVPPPPVEKTIPGYFRLKDLDNTMGDVRLTDESDNGGVEDIVANKDWGLSVDSVAESVTNYADIGLQDMTNLGDLSGVHSEKLAEDQPNGPLREFYGKFLQTDAQIRKLKKLAEQNDYTHPVIRKRRAAHHPRIVKREEKEKAKECKKPEPKKEECAKNCDCEKKCKCEEGKKCVCKDGKCVCESSPVAKNTTPKLMDKIKKKMQDILNLDANKKGNLTKRDIPDHPAGIKIERKKVVIHFLKPEGARKSKCSHVNSESRPHDKLLKHPYNQNTQRLDEFLEKFLEGNFQLDPVFLEGLFKTSNLSKCSHRKYRPEDNPVVDKSADWSSQNYRQEDKSDKSTDWSSGKYGGERYPDKSGDWSADDISNILMKFKVGNSNRDFDDLKQTTPLPRHFQFKDYVKWSSFWQPATTAKNDKQSKSSLTYLNNDPSPPNRISEVLLERVPNLRRLLQADDDDGEILRYEDLNEVLKDDLEMTDEEGGNRGISRVADEKETNLVRRKKDDEKKSNSFDEIPNWKGPTVLLYPDEIVYMFNENKLKGAIVKTGNNSPKENLKEVYRLQENKYPQKAKEEEEEQTAMIDDMNEFNRWLENKNFLTIPPKKEKLKDTKATRPTVATDKNVEEFENDIQMLEKNSEESTPPLLSKDEINEIVKKTLHTFNQAGTSKNKGFPISHKSKRDAYDDDYYSEEFGMNKEDFVQDSEFNDKIADVEFLEDYTNKNDKVDKMAQAYSDYGVFEGKKGLRFNKMDEQHADSRVKLGAEDSEKKDKNFFGKFQVSVNGSNQWVKGLIDHYKKIIKQSNSADSDNKKSSSDRGLISLSYYNPKTPAPKQLADGIPIIMPHYYNHAAFSRTTATPTFDTLNDISRTKSKKIYAGKRKLLSLDTEEKDGGERNVKLVKREPLCNVSETANVNENIEKETVIEKGVTSYDDNLQHEIDDDDDEFEKITHRSRVLFSVEDKIGNMSDVTGLDKGSSNMETTVKYLMSTTVNTPKAISEDIKADINTTPKSIYNETKINDIRNKHKNITEGSEINTSDVKVVVKRSAPLQDSGLLFWNDIYDDEYGSKMDPLDEETNSEETYKVPDIIKRAKPRKWFSDKMKTFRNMIHTKDKVDSVFKKRLVRGAEDVSNSGRTASNKSDRRKQKAEDIENFEALTARMKEVCKKAAKIVQQTRNIKARKEEPRSRSADMSSSLMQQLAQLMSDLVDFQVHERTCLKLPEDLKDFLSWLTGPEETAQLVTREPQWNPDLSGLDPAVGDQLYTITDEATSPADIDSYLMQTKRDKRSQCRESIHSVEELMSQYDSLSNEDQGKMAGVREYLQDQLDFLDSQIATQDHNDMVSSEYLNRVKRSNDKYNEDSKKKRNFHRKHANFRSKRFYFRNFGKKYTRSTISNVDDVYLVTENPAKKVKRFSFRKHTIIPKNVSYAIFTSVGNVVDKEAKEMHGAKRNLQDVYYNAVSVAKKYTEAEQVRKDVTEKVEIATSTVNH